MPSFLRNRHLALNTLSALVLVPALCAPLAASAQSAAPQAAQSDAPPAASKPRTYALVSAVGDQINFAARRMETGTNFEGYRRTRLAISDKSVDAAVLRGMDRVLARREPDSTRVFLRLAPGELDGVPAPKREEVALAKLRAELSKLPQRAQWDQIIIITPYYRMSEMRGLAGKLHGVGLYVQSMDTNVDALGAEATGGQVMVEGPETVMPDGTPSVRSSKYLALYSYTQVWILDAKTLEVIRNEPWMFNEKINDITSGALDAFRQLPPEKLAERFESFAERAAGRALAQTVPQVTPGELRAPPPAR
jgi:hypothetical protein